MLANHEFLVRSDVDKSLRDNGVETSTTSVSVVDAYHSEVVSLT